MSEEELKTVLCTIDEVKQAAKAMRLKLVTAVEALQKIAGPGTEGGNYTDCPCDQCVARRALESIGE